MVAQASACELNWYCRGARIRPLFGRSRQSCAYRVVFDPGFDFLKLSGVADPMIEGFVLPEWLSRAAENRVSHTSRFSFDRPRDDRQVVVGPDQNVYVVRHHYKGMQFVCGTGFFPETIQYACCDFGMTQPGGSIERPIQQSVLGCEDTALLTTPAQIRKTAGEAPCHEQHRARRMPVGKVPPVHTKRSSAEQGRSSQGECHRLKPVPPSR
jgi:hypothetical protein